MVRCGLTVNIEKMYVQKRWAMCLQYITCFRFNSQPDWSWGGVLYDNLLSSRIFNLIMNQILGGHTSNSFQKEDGMGWYLFFKVKNHNKVIINKRWPFYLIPRLKNLAY